MRRDVYQAIADPTRRAILDLIAQQPLTPNAIADHFGSSRQAVSKHLQMLKDCQLVHTEQHGREIYYHLNPEALRILDTWLSPFRPIWQKRFLQLEVLLKKMNYR
jgi:DNA-binding transcriptional ArsR family regulator